MMREYIQQMNQKQTTIKNKMIWSASFLVIIEFIYVFAPPPPYLHVIYFLNVFLSIRMLYHGIRFWKTELYVEQLQHEYDTELEKRSSE